MLGASAVGIYLLVKPKEAEAAPIRTGPVTTPVEAQARDRVSIQTVGAISTQLENLQDLWTAGQIDKAKVLAGLDELYKLLKAIPETSPGVAIQKSPVAFAITGFRGTVARS
jgi:hypothetical protein